MLKPKSSLILSPNLGCPEIVSLPAINQRGFRVVIAAPGSEELDLRKYALRARLSFGDQSQELTFELSGADKLTSERLPSQFADVGETRLLISTTLRTGIFPHHDFWGMWARPTIEVEKQHLRTVNGNPRSTLYDLALSVRGVVVGRVRHALYLRLDSPSVKFAHLTDLHVAARNDLWEAEVRAVIEGSDPIPGRQDFKNFNGRLREFIKWANEAADEGHLDFVWALGDLVDFCRTGLFDRTPDDSNWSTLIDILTGSPAESSRGNEGLTVPIFTTTGNHDWRTYPYSPAQVLGIFGITKECAEELDFWYRNTSVEIGEKLEDVNQELIRKGSPLLARSWWGAITSMGYRGLIVGTQRLWQRAKAVAVSYGRQLGWSIFGVTGFAAGLKLLLTVGPGSAWHHIATWVSHHVPFAITIGVLFVLLVLASVTFPSWLYARLRTTLEDLIAIEAEVGTISEYFVRMNPYLNYAFELDNCAFIVLDTGPDCLTAQSFWDAGGKKVRKISVRDNMIGRAPDMMGFYPANEYYPYSQIAWLEAVLACLGAARKNRRTAELYRRRVFVGLHAPPANLSGAQRRRAEQDLQRTPASDELQVLMRKRRPNKYDIRYGTANHYLSQFFYICLGYRERDQGTFAGPAIDAVFAGHAHWNMEFQLRKPEDAASSWSPELLYGRFSEQVEATCDDRDAQWGPLLLQTAACGPLGAVATEVPPNFRYVAVSNEGTVCKLRPCNLSNLPRLDKLKQS